LTNAATDPDSVPGNQTKVTINNMNRPPRFLNVLIIVATVITSSSTFAAKEIDLDPQGYYGVGTTPAVYLVNFFIMYISSPNDAANMPAYRAPIPADLSGCLNTYPNSPELCHYSDYALFFVDEPFKVKKSKKCELPPACRSSEELESLAPPIATSEAQLNEPLGLKRANEIAKSLGITGDMILTDTEWACTLGSGVQPRVQELISSCLANLTNSNGNTNIPLSSYGLAIDESGDVQSLCAPSAPCLEFNYLFIGPLERLAFQCGWLEKFHKLRENPLFQEAISEGGDCQAFAGAGDQACIVNVACD